MRPWRQPARACRRDLIHVVVLFALTVVTPRAEEPTKSPDLGDLLDRVGRRIEEWYGRAQTIVSRETVWIQPLRSDMTPLDFPRRLAYELRVSWDPKRTANGIPKADVLRDKIAVNGRPLVDNDARAECMDPKPVSPEPLAMLLAVRRAESAFSFEGETRMGRRAAWIVDFRGVRPGEPEITWTDECVTVSLPGRSRGRIWIDAQTYDVLRLDDRLSGQFTFAVPDKYVKRGAASSMVIERAESSIRYVRVRFEDPVETLMLPATIEAVTVIRGGAVQRVRITQRLSDHRRFLTGGRIVG